MENMHGKRLYISGADGYGKVCDARAEGDEFYVHVVEAREGAIQIRHVPTGKWLADKAPKLGLSSTQGEAAIFVLARPAFVSS